MNRNTLVVEIKRPVNEVFEFTVSPNNTPKWIKSVLVEETSSEIIGVGTIYNQLVNIGSGKQHEVAYKVVTYELNKRFELQRIGDNYKCSYIYEAIEGGTRLTYIEEVGVGQVISDPLEMDTLNLLKKLLEIQN